MISKTEVNEVTLHTYDSQKMGITLGYAKLQGLGGKS